MMRDAKGHFVAGHGFTPEMLEKMAAAKIGKPPWNKGIVGPASHLFGLARAGHPPWNKGQPMSAEIRSRVSAAKMGATPWNKGIGTKTSDAKKLRSSLQYRQWRDAVFRRDNYTCQVCGERGGRLDADHIKSFAEFPELRLDLDNGRTLCHDCHRASPNYGTRNVRLMRQRSNP